MLKILTHTLGISIHIIIVNDKISTHTNILLHHLIPSLNVFSHFILCGSDGTRDSGAFEAAVAFRYFLQVLLVIVLSVVELLPPPDLCRDGAEAFFIQLLGVKTQT